MLRTKSSILFTESGSQGTPPSGFQEFYCDTGGLKAIDYQGTITNLQNIGETVSSGEAYIGQFQENIGELAFDLAIYKNQSQYFLSDGVAINYNDISGVDTGVSVNYYHNATGEFIHNNSTGVANMELVSTSYSAASAPTDAAFTMRFVQPNSDVTVGTDIVVEVSRDGGTTWSTVTLTELRTSGTTTVCSGTVDISGQPSGTTLKSRITTPGGTPKEVQIIAHTLQIE